MVRMDASDILLPTHYLRTDMLRAKHQSNGANASKFYLASIYNRSRACFLVLKLLGMVLSCDTLTLV